MNLLRPEFSARAAEPGTHLVGAYASPECSAPLVRRLLAESDEALAALRGVHGPAGIVLAGEPDALPWVDGLVYLRACKCDSAVWLPSTAVLSIPEDLFARALRRSQPRMGGLVVALPDTRQLIPLRDARPLTRPHLEAWS